MPQSPRNISIIGAGRVGTALACLAERAGYTVVAVASRRRESVDRACRMLGKTVGVDDPIEAARRGGMVLITTTDDAITSVCDALARGGAFNSESIVAHCSGGLSSEALISARERCGAAIGSIHPMQTFATSYSAISHFAGTWCYCEGDETAVRALRELFAAIGGRVEQIATAGKTLYHAAGVMACNYLVALLDAAVELAERAGIDPTQALEALHPLVATTVRNVKELGMPGALTGPIARGDVNTVNRHVRAIEHASPQLATLYKALGRRAVAIGQAKGTLDAAAVAALRNILEESEERNA